MNLLWWCWNFNVLKLIFHSDWVASGALWKWCLFELHLPPPCWSWAGAADNAHNGMETGAYRRETVTGRELLAVRCRWKASLSGCPTFLDKQKRKWVSVLLVTQQDWDGKEKHEDGKWKCVRVGWLDEYIGYWWLAGSITGCFFF